MSIVDEKFRKVRLDQTPYLFHFMRGTEDEAKTILEQLKSKEETLIFYESPHHIEETVKLLHECLGNREIVIARELTKLNEEYIRGTLDEFEGFDYNTLKGEMVVLVHGNNETSNDISDEDIKERLLYYLGYEISKKVAIELTSHDLKVGKNRVYSIAQKL